MGGREGKGRRERRDSGRGVEGKENGDRPPTIFGLKVALWPPVTVPNLVALGQFTSA